MPGVLTWFKPPSPCVPQPAQL